MFRYLLNSAALLILPRAQTVVSGIAKALTIVEAREAALARYVEDQAVRIGQLQQQRRDAVQAVHDAFDRKQDRKVRSVHKARDEQSLAIDARMTVQNLINRG